MAPYKRNRKPVILRLIKWSIDAGEHLFAPVFFNRSMPEVGRVERNVVYGPHPKQRLDVFVPPPIEGRARSRRVGMPLLIFIHGGAWIAGDKFAYERICRVFASEGFLTFNVNYGLWPQEVFPVPSQHVAAAIRWAYDRAAEFGGDTSRVFLAGDSAGAHLALSYAAGQGKPELFEATGVKDPVPAEAIRGLLLFYGVYDCRRIAASNRLGTRLGARKLLGSDPATFDERLRVVSPILHLTRSLPPCFIAAGEFDFLYADSVALDAELARLGVPRRTMLLAAREYPTAWHAFLMFYRRKCARVVMREAISFLHGLESERQPPEPRG